MARPVTGELHFAPVDYSPLRERMLRLRTLRGWDQPRLAELTGSNQSLVSQVERGRKDPTEEFVERVANAFGVSVSFLMADHQRTDPSDPWLRAYADASKRETKVRTAAAATAAEYIDLLDLEVIPDRMADLIDDDGRVDMPAAPLDPDDMAEVDEIAMETREQLNMGDGAVVANMVRAAERLGCIVLPLETELGRHMGMSLLSNGLPMLFVAKANVSGDRQRFTVAHEVGHLILHSGLPAPRTVEQANLMERQANRFAAAFLAPADAVIESLHTLGGGRVTLGTLASVKAHWGVSIKMLVGRFRSLGVIATDEQARSLYKQISARRWTRVEPVEVPLEHAQWFDYRIRDAAGIDDLPAAAHELADRIGGNADDLLSFADWTDRPLAPVADLASRRSSNKHTPG